MIDEQVFVDIGRFMAQQNKILSDRIDSIALGVDTNITIFTTDIDDMKGELTTFYNEFYSRLNTSENTFLSKVSIIDNAIASINTSTSLITSLNRDTIISIKAFDNRINVQENIMDDLLVTMDIFRSDYTTFTTSTNAKLTTTESTLNNKIINVNNDLALKLNIEKGRIDSILSLSDTDKDSFKEMVDYVQSLNNTTDATFTSYLVSNNIRSTAIEANIDIIENTIIDLTQTIYDNKAVSDTSILLLNSKLIMETSRIDAILNASETDKDSFKEIVDLINSIDIENDSSLASYISTTNATISTHQSLINNRYSKEQSDTRFLGIETNAVSSSRLLTPRKIEVSGDLSGYVYFDGTSDVNIVVEVDPSTHNHDTTYLGINAKAVDSDKLDGLDSTQFLRKDISEIINGDFTISNSNIPKLNFVSTTSNAISMTISPSSKGLDFYKSSTPNDILFKILPDGVDSSNGYKWNGQSIDSRYLGLHAKAVDSDKLDGLDSTDFVRNNSNQALDFQALSILGDVLSLHKADGSTEDLSLYSASFSNQDVIDIVGTMVTNNYESGIFVTYNQTDNKLDFLVKNPIISLSGDVSGSATMVGLNDVDIIVSILDNSHNHTIDNIADLQDILDNETISRINAYDELTSVISNEITNRISTDTTITNNLITETNRAKSVESSLQSDVATINNNINNMNVVINSKITYYEGPIPPLTAMNGSIWKDTDDGILYMAYTTSTNVTDWFQI